MSTHTKYEVAGLESREIAFLRNRLSPKDFQEFAGLRHLKPDRDAPLPYETPLVAIPAFLDLPPKILDILESEGMVLLGDVVRRTEKYINGIPGIGPRYREQLYEAVRRSGRYVGEGPPFK